VISESSLEVVTLESKKPVFNNSLRISKFSYGFLKISFTKSSDKILVVPSQIGSTCASLKITGIREFSMYPNPPKDSTPSLTKATHSLAVKSLRIGVINLRAYFFWKFP
jgi:hypothetical protein